MSIKVSGEVKIKYFTMKLITSELIFISCSYYSDNKVTTTAHLSAHTNAHSIESKIITDKKGSVVNFLYLL